MKKENIFFVGMVILMGLLVMSCANPFTPTGQYSHAERDSSVREYSSPVWKYKTGANVDSSPAISGSTVYVGSDDGYVYALHKDGGLRWKYKTGGAVKSSPAVGSRGYVYVGSDDNYVYALRGGDGELIWEYYTGAGDVKASPAIGKFGRIYVGDDSGSFYALSADGKLKWQYNAAKDFRPQSKHVYSFSRAKFVSKAAIGEDGYVYVGSYNGALYKFDPSTSSTTLKTWVKWTGGPIVSSPAIAQDGTVYVGSQDNYVYAFTSDGDLKWKRYTGAGDVSGSPVIGQDGTVYIGDDSGTLYALNPVNGKPRWEYQLPIGRKFGYNKIITAPAIADDGRIYVGSHDGHVYVFTPGGELKWKYRTGNAYSVWSSPAISSDRIFIGSQDNYIHAIENISSYKESYSPAELSETAMWPRLGFNNKGGGSVASFRGVTLEWSYETGASYSGTLIGPDDTVYTVASDQRMYAFDERGQLKWRTEPLVNVDATPALRSGNIYVGGVYGSVLIFDSSTGRHEKSLTTEKVSVAPVVGQDGKIYVVDWSDLHVYSDAGGTNQLDWKFQTPHSFKYKPALGANGIVYIVSGKKLYAVRKLNTIRYGSEIVWEYEAENFITAAPVVEEESGVIYVGGEGFVHAIDSNGNVKWTQEVLGVPREPVAAPTDSDFVSVYVTTSEGYVYSLSKTYGGKNWEVRKGENSLVNPLIGVDNNIVTLYTASANNSLYAIDPINGSTKWTYTASGRIHANLATKNNSIYVKNSFGHSGYISSIRKLD